MRIALLTTDGREFFRKYEATVPTFGTAPQALLDGFAAMGAVEVHVVSCSQQPLQSIDKLADNVWFHSLHVPKIGWMRTGYSGCIRAVRQKVREIDPDIVHGQGTERDCAISAVFSGRPNVLTIHGNMRLIARLNQARPFSFAWLNAHLEAFTLPRTDGVVCITRYTQDAVASLARKTWLLPNAVDPSFFTVPRHPREPALLICVGVVCLRKNQNAFIRSLDALAGVRSLRLVFIGPVPDDDYGREFHELVQTRSWCHYAGVAGRAELRTWFSAATMVVLPSLEDNCPMAVLEGMAAGVPVMAANVGGVPDLIVDRVTGILCDPLDKRSMAEAVETLLGEPDLTTEIATEAAAQARKRFHPQVIAARHLEIYDEVLSSRR